MVSRWHFLKQTFYAELLQTPTPIKFQGKNFAKSPLFSCSFGTESKVGQFPSLSNGEFPDTVWPYSQGEVLANTHLSKLGSSSDGDATPLGVYTITSAATLSFIEPTIISPNEIECSPPVVSSPASGYFGPGNPTLLDTVPFEYLNSAMKCNGSASDTVDSIPSLLNGTRLLPPLGLSIFCTIASSKNNLFVFVLRVVFQEPRDTA